MWWKQSWKWRRNGRLCGAGFTAGITIRKQGSSMSEENNITEKQATAAKKPYEKPSFRFEKVFVTSALSCGKTGTQAQCSLNIKVS